MALRDQPYMPLYIQDFLTDEKLNECSASTTGVYIKIMCLMHKSSTYGKILLRQKSRQNLGKEKIFAEQLAKHLPFTVDEIFAALTELIEEKVCQFEGDYLVQKRMVHDNEISEKRSIAGRKGAVKTNNTNKKNADNFAAANCPANTEYEYLLVNSSSNNTIEYIIQQIENFEKIKIDETEKQLFMKLVVEMIKTFIEKNPQYHFHKESDYSACLQIAYHIAQMKNWRKAEVLNGKLNDTLKSWGTITDFIKNDNWLSTRSLSDLSSVKEWQRLVQKMTADTGAKQKPEQQPKINLK